PEHASKAGVLQVDALEHLAAFAHTYAPRPVLIQDRRPDRAIRVQADAVAAARTADLGPNAPVREAAIVSDVECRQVAGERRGDHEGLVVRANDHAVGKRDAVGHLAHGPVRGDQGDETGPEVLLAEAEVDAVHVDVGAAVDDDLVPAIGRQAAQ